MKNWNYAVHSHMVKTYGGPAKYGKTIAELAIRETNKKWLCGVVPVATVLVPFAVKGIYDIVQEHREKICVDASKNDETAHINEETEELPCL